MTSIQIKKNVQKAHISLTSEASCTYPILCVVCVWIDGLDNDVAMEEMGGDHAGYKWSVLLLEDYGYNVVTDMALSL